MELLGHVGDVESRFDMFLASVQDSCLICVKSTIGS
jgi:hypothetical protein